VKNKHIIIIIFAVSLFACSPGEINTPATTVNEALPPSQPGADTTTSLPSPTVSLAGKRKVLTYQQLMDGFDPGSPVDDGAFAMPADALPAEHVFEGRLELIGENTQENIQVLRGNPDVDPEVPQLPEFDYEFVQSGDYFVPVQRGLIITDHPIWNYIIEPGRVWQEKNDGGFSRVSFPFSLVWKGSNAIFNGVMIFLFNDQVISKVWYQTTQETSISFSIDLWGQLEASYHPEPISKSEQIRTAFEDERSQRFPTKPIEQLAEDYPQVDVSQFGRGISKNHLTYYGFVINGINYVSSCPTRYGEYAYCEYLRAPSYSTAKSTFPSLVLMRLAQKYDPEVGELLIKEYVPEYADSPGDWSTVTFDHTLDMATGNFRSAGYMEDEEHFDSDPFWNEEYYAERIAAAFNWPNGGKPGSQWVYRTFDTFIVTRALHNYLQSHEGPQADIFEFLVNEIFIPINVGPGAHTSARTKDNNWQGQPYGGYGLWWIQDDIAKITNFLNVDHGAVGDEQLLHPDYLAAALQLDSSDRGVDIDSRAKYNNAFWARVYDQEEGFECEFWVPQMLGYSGIVIVTMPNGSSYYYASDNREFTWLDALQESDKIIPHCP
jgi:hypothetical protein